MPKINVGKRQKQRERIPHTLVLCQFILNLIEMGLPHMSDCCNYSIYRVAVDEMSLSCRPGQCRLNVVQVRERENPQAKFLSPQDTNVFEFTKLLRTRLLQCTLENSNDSECKTKSVREI